MENRLDVLGVGIDKVTSQQALEKIGEFIASGQPHQIVTANAEIIYHASKNEKMRKSLHFSGFSAGKIVFLPIGF